MANVIDTMLSRYPLNNLQQCNLALREIIQEIALVGLWRSKFFETAAFYGGTALRILYGLDRYSEDLDFSLLQTHEQFSLDPYNKAITRELNAYGFTVQVQTKQKNIETNIQSAFIKANTKHELIRVGLPEATYKKLHSQATVKIKLEVDTHPPLQFSTEAKPIMDPIPVSINTFIASDLFAGKMHAVLCRSWKNRIKGRDWYDFLWFVRKNVSLNLVHLEARMKQSGHLKQSEALTQQLFLNKLETKINNLDIDNALMDIRPFVRDEAQIASWSEDYFIQFAKMIKFV